ncbi:MAG TPA: aminotransferase class V-fold PLP-dependent enzyme [Bryobacterales bacterium]|nr:aminotransferase class V-fold PLP-dependent enzyme [Bryobacterales bacterium]
MNGFRSSWDRRRFLLAAGLASTVGVLRPSNLYAAYLADRHGESYRALGVRPLINAAGTYTTLTGSVISPEVRDAMAEASRYFVPLIDLQLAVGERIAKMIGVEAAMVTCGAASSITLATAACVTQGDPEKVRRIPDTTGMKNEVIMVKSHRMGFDHAARAAGTKIIEVETPEELEKAINEKTAMLFYVHLYEQRGKINRNHFIAAGKRHNVPVFNDAAAELPPVTNLSAIVGEGFDLVGFSGGKGLRGPQASGLLVGRKNLIDAAHKNNNPHSDTIGRAMKVGKEEIMGLLKAVEIYRLRDHDHDQEQWRGFMERIAKMVGDVPSIQSEVYIPGPGGHPIPYLRVQWDQSKLGLTYSECSKALQEGEPRIDLNTTDNGLELASYNLFPGEERIVGMRLREVLLEAAKKA